MEEIRLIVARGTAFLSGPHAPAPARAVPDRRRPAALAPRSGRARGALERAIVLAADEGAQLVCLQELTLSRYFAVDPAGPEASGVEPEELPGGPTHRFAARMAAETGDPRPRLAVRARGGRRRARLQHGDHRRARWRAARPHPQAAHPGDRRLPRGSLLPSRPGRRRALPARRPRRGPSRPADLLGPVVSRARPRLQPRGSRRARLSDRDRLRARPSGLRHRAAVGAGDHRQRDRQRGLHGRRQPLRRGAAAALLRLVVHLRSLRAQARCRPRATNRPCWSPTSTSTSAATGSSCFPSSPPAARTPMSA